MSNALSKHATVHFGMQPRSAVPCDAGGGPVRLVDDHLCRDGCR